jgi:Asp-tRNA(Asn)/Glu-tRNA(Gln) amidotransferase A subunit family amidase
MASRFDRRLPTFRAPAPQRAPGLRPTFGRISRAGATAHCWSLDKVGPICRSVEDTAMVLAALNGADLADRGSIDAPFNFDAEADISKLRLGYLPEAFGEGANEVDRAALAAARGLGIEVVEVSLPDLPYDALMNILYAEAAAAFEDLTLDDVDDALKWQDDGAWPNTFRKARFLSAVNHVQLDRLRYQVMLALDDLFADVDALIGPLLIGPFMTGPMLIASNFTGHPCLHLRSGFLELPTRGMASLAAGKLTIGEPQASDRTFNVPQGISLCGRLFEESVILNLGLALEQELAVAGVRPGLAS